MFYFSSEVNFSSVIDLFLGVHRPLCVQLQMNLARVLLPISRSLIYAKQSDVVRRCALSTNRPETISAALKKFYLKVHPDLFTQHPKEKVRAQREHTAIHSTINVPSGCEREEFAISQRLSLRAATEGVHGSDHRDLLYETAEQRIFS